MSSYILCTGTVIYLLVNSQNRTGTEQYLLVYSYTHTFIYTLAHCYPHWYLVIYSLVPSYILPKTVIYTHWYTVTLTGTLFHSLVHCDAHPGTQW